MLAAISGTGGAIAGAAASWRRSGTESESIAVSTLKGVIEELRSELDRKEAEIGNMRSRLDKLDHHLSLIADLPPEHLA